MDNQQPQKHDIVSVFKELGLDVNELKDQLGVDACSPNLFSILPEIGNKSSLPGLQ